MCYDSCESYAANDDDAGWAIPPADEEDLLRCSMAVEELEAKFAAARLAVAQQTEMLAGLRALRDDAAQRTAREPPAERNGATGSRTRLPPPSPSPERKRRFCCLLCHLARLAPLRFTHPLRLGRGLWLCRGLRLARRIRHGHGRDQRDGGLCGLCGHLPLKDYWLRSHLTLATRHLSS